MSSQLQNIKLHSKMPATGKYGEAYREEQTAAAGGKRWGVIEAVVTNVHRKLKLSNRLCPNVSTG